MGSRVYFETNNGFQGIMAALVLIAASLAFSCNRGASGSEPASLFTLLPGDRTGITFLNQVDYTEEYNTYTYRNFYNGAGVGLGDFNNDGFIDIYFCGNITDNKLYINKGEFVFEDVTEHAGVACSDVWCTGVSIADVNGDGWQDIYVCKSGDPEAPNRHNELFINNGDLTFTEQAREYGIADMGLSTHASFFDYDRDGDLDCYLLNNSFQSVTQFDFKPEERRKRDTLGGNKLYRNDGGSFSDVSETAGIYGSKIGFGLGVSVGDVNRDGWIDLYISNDFFERDYLYINKGDGTFSESLEEQMTEISLGAMGADVGDINNDTYPDIFVTEMTAEGDRRLKTKVLFDSWETYQTKVAGGYHHQFARNVLQLNNRNGSYSEIGRLSGVSATDWSWGALIMDLDNDGWKDIFVANGIYKDLLDRDFLDLYSDPSVMRTMIRTEESAILSIIDQIPSERIPNYAFHNNGDLTFTNLAAPWGLATPSFSNGAAYGDLDNDGDLDLVVNNVNMPSFIYRNETPPGENQNFLTVQLRGSGANTGAIGAGVTLFYSGKMLYQEQVPMRGFKSCVDHRLHFGLGPCNLIDSLIVQWPDGSTTLTSDIPVNQFLEMDQQNEMVRERPVGEIESRPLFSPKDSPSSPEYTHVEDEYSDFDRESLLFTMLSNEGPHMAVGDVNGDGWEDLYICGARGTPGTLFVQLGGKRFRATNEALFGADRISEETDCAFFDADGDSDLDLYVACGGNEFSSSSSALLDRLYLNNGQGVFSKSGQLLPAGKYESTSCVTPADFDGDGDLDLFVGIRLTPFQYGVPVNGYLLENDGKGSFSNVSDSNAPGLKGIGMVTDMTWADVDRDGDPDMAIVGDWMPVKLFINNNGIFSDESLQFGLSGTQGWWNVIVALDLDGDGFPDFALGNHGLNSRFKASAEKPVTMYVNDFDLNGRVEQIICTYEGDRSFPLVMKDELVRQIPVLEKKYPTYDSYKEQTMEDIFSAEVLERSVRLESRIMASCLAINSGSGSFRLTPLPLEAQFSPVYALVANDFDGDGNCDLLLGGNQTRAKPETGIYNAGFGLFLKGNKDGAMDAVPSEISGIFVKGEIRDLELMSAAGKRVIAVARNNEPLLFFNY